MVTKQFIGIPVQSLDFFLSKPSGMLEALSLTKDAKTLTVLLQFVCFRKLPSSQSSVCKDLCSVRQGRIQTFLCLELHISTEQNTDVKKSRLQKWRGKPTVPFFYLGCRI